MLAHPLQALLRLVVLLDHRLVRRQPLDLFHHLLVFLDGQRRSLLLQLKSLDLPFYLLNGEVGELVAQPLHKILLLLLQLVGSGDLVVNIALLLLQPA